MMTKIRICLASSIGFFTVISTLGFAPSLFPADDGVFSSGVPTNEANILLLNVVNQLAFKEFRSGISPLICIPNAIPEAIVTQLRSDACSLQHAGFGTAAGVASGMMENIRKDVHQVWLQTPGSCRTLEAFVGSVSARKSLYRFIEALRHSLEGPRLLPMELVELSYLFYKQGSFYSRHVDTIADKNDERKHVRAISMILYLGDNEVRSWDCKIDGGALRIYGNEYAKLTGYSIHVKDEETYADIPPLPGTLVLFDSDKVAHEVLRTERSRVCCVGWLGSPQ